MSPKLFSAISDPRVGPEVAGLKETYGDVKSAESRYIAEYHNLERAVAIYENRRRDLLVQFCAQNNLAWCGLCDQLVPADKTFLAFVLLYSVTDQGYQADKKAEVLCRGCDACHEKFFFEPFREYKEWLKNPGKTSFGTPVVYPEFFDLRGKILWGKGFASESKECPWHLFPQVDDRRWYEVGAFSCDGQTRKYMEHGALKDIPSTSEMHLPPGLIGDELATQAQLPPAVQLHEGSAYDRHISIRDGTAGEFLKLQIDPHVS